MTKQHLNKGIGRICISSTTNTGTYNSPKLWGYPNEGQWKGKCQNRYFNLKDVTVLYI